MIWFLKPKDDKGIAFLKKEEEGKGKFHESFPREGSPQKGSPGHPKRRPGELPGGIWVAKKATSFSTGIN